MIRFIRPAPVFSGGMIKAMFVPPKPVWNRARQGSDWATSRCAIGASIYGSGSDQES